MWWQWKFFCSNRILSLWIFYRIFNNWRPPLLLFSSEKNKVLKLTDFTDETFKIFKLDLKKQVLKLFFLTFSFFFLLLETVLGSTFFPDVTNIFFYFSKILQRRFNDTFESGSLHWFHLVQKRVWPLNQNLKKLQKPDLS